MYSFTRCSIESHEARMQNGIRNVVSRMNGIEKPSTPSLKRIVSVSQEWLSTSWNDGVDDIEPRPGHERQEEGRDRRRERRPAGVGAYGLAVAAQGQDERRADEREDEKAERMPKPSISGLP